MAWDTQRTRTLLLDAATTLFARAGLAGTRIDAIAREAGVNKERIYSYFGNKEGLFEAVLERELEGLLEGVSAPGTGAEAVGAFAGALWDRFSAAPHLPRLLAWEGLEWAEACLGGPERTASCAGVIGTLEGALPGVGEEDAAQLLLSIVTLASAWWSLPQMGGFILGHAASADPAVLAGRTARRREALVTQVTAAARGLAGH